MAVGPAGWSLRGDPLTCTEAAVAVGLDAWSEQNIRWNNAMQLRNIMFGLTFGFTVFILFSPIWVALAFFSLVIAIIIQMTVKPIPVRFPMVAITAHGWASFGPVNHLVTNSLSQGIDLSIFKSVTDRNQHAPANHPESNQLRSGYGDSASLSVSSLQALSTDENQYLMTISKTPIQDLRLAVVNFEDGMKFNDTIRSNFSGSNLNSTIGWVSISPLDDKVISQSQVHIDWFIKVNQYNNDLFKRVLSSIEIDRSSYEKWADRLLEDGQSRSNLVLDSTRQGWDHSTLGVDAAEDALERSVAADIIAQQEAVQREMERAEEHIREREAEIGIENAKEEERLTMKYNEAGSMHVSIGRQLQKIQSISIDPSLELRTKYGVTTGGQGNFGVSTTVKTEHYTIPNPAWATRDAIVEIIRLEELIIERKRDSLKTRIRDLDGAKERMLENLLAQRNERLQRLEDSKKRALSAIRKDALEVRSLEKKNYQTNQIINQTVESFWLHAHNFVQRQIEQLIETESKIDEIFSRIQSSNEATIDILRKSGLSQHGGVPLLQHWMIINGNLYSDTRSAAPIDFSSGDKVTVSQGPASNVFNPDLTQTHVQPIPASALLPSIHRLKELGIIDERMMNKLAKLRTEEIVSRG